MSIRENRHLKVLFKLSHWTGLWIPDSGRDSGCRCTLWEALIFIYSVTVFFLIMTALISTLPSFKIAHMGSVVIVAMLYIMTLTKTFAFIARKDKFVKILTMIDEITKFRPFKNDQSRLVDAACKSVRKTALTLLIVNVVSISSVFFAHGLFESKIENSNITSVEDDKSTVDLIKSSRESNFQLLAFGLHFKFCFILLVKNILMDSFMLLCHYVVVHEIKLLTSQYTKYKNVAMSGKIFHAHSDFDQWIELLDKTRRCQKAVNNFFGPQILAVVACGIVVLCLVAFTAAAFPSAIMLFSNAQMIMVFVMQIMVCCRSGQLLLDAGEDLAFELSTGPWPVSTQVPCLHLIVADVQKTFASRGGPFFTVNFEFFASIMGAVFTYFIVLVQIKD